MMHDAKTLARFMAKVDKDGPDGCWLWTGAMWKKGYGRFKIADRYRFAHRVSYEMHVGPIPDGLTIDHVHARGCRHRHCVNPAHLEAVSNTENVLRGVGPTAVNAAKTHCKNGHAFSPENTRVRRGRRICRTCERQYERARRPPV